jgi:GLPGLI family protein
MNKLLALAAVIGFSQNIIAQGFTVVYEATSVITNEMILQDHPELSNKEVIYKYSLKIDDNKSLFSRDSLIVHVNTTSLNSEEYWPYQCIYKNYNQDKWIESSGRYTEGYAYERSLSDLIEKNHFNWEKSDLTKKVAGVECIQVVSKNNTAWYAPTIPFPDGPAYGIFGLSGLVLQFDNGQDFWTATKIIFENTTIIAPSTETTNNIAQIKISYDEIKALPQNKVILINSATPLHKWLKFEQ